MDAYSAIHFLFLSSFVLAVLQHARAQGTTTPAQGQEVVTSPTLEVTEGEMATFPCTFDTTNLVGIDWKRGADKDSAETLLRTFKGRMILVTDDVRFNLTSDFSLTLQNSRINDSDIYWCQVSLSQIYYSSTNLTVSPPKKQPDPIAESTTGATTPPPTTPSPTTQPPSSPLATRSATASPASTGMPGGAGSASVQTTSGAKTTQAPVTGTEKPVPEKLSNNKTILIIVPCAVGLIIIAILVLVCYCCCCKRKSDKGYAHPKPV